jgi:hypothetical protein
VSRTRPGVRKADVVAALDRERERLLRLATDLGEERASAPVVGEWSVRDVIGHCIYWQGMLARMMGGHLAPPAWIPRWQAEAELGTDELNRLTADHYRRVRWDTLLADFRYTSDLVQAIVAGMKEENLMLPAGDPWGGDTKVHEAIAGESHGHWKEHADELERLLKA